MAKTNRIKLLVVDDEEIICRYIEHRFKKRGLEVFFALSGEEALVIFEKERPEIIVLDIMMKGINGVEVVRRIKEKFSLPKIIVVSALGNKENVEELKAQGVSCYLTKPILLKELDGLILNFKNELQKKNN